MNHLRILRPGVFTVVFIAFFSSVALAAPANIKTIYIFGDSLSDIGNDLLLSQDLPEGGLEIPPTERYFDGRFSNGPVWVDFLAEYLNIKSAKFFPSLDGKMRLDKRHSVSYAHGGSTTFVQNDTPASPLLPSLTVQGLLGQVNSFSMGLAESGMTADPQALYVVWSGANDYVLAGVPGTGIPFPPNPGVTVGNILAAIEQLYDLGARRFLIANLPNLGNIPASALLGPEVQQGLEWLTGTHNGLLLQGLISFANTHQDSTIDQFNAFSLITGIATFPSAFGFTNTFTDLGPASNCLIPLFLPDQPQDCSELPNEFDAGGSVFWDSQHPTTELHRYIAIRSFLCVAIEGSCTIN